MVRQIHGLGALQMGVAGHRPVQVALGGDDQRPRQALDPVARVLCVGVHEHRHVGRDLIVARARRVQPAADRTDDLGETPLDRHMDVLVVLGEREGAVAQLVADLLEAADQLVAVQLGDDLAFAEHRRVRDRLVDVVGSQPPVESDRVVERPERVVLARREAAAGDPALTIAAARAHDRSTAVSASATWATCPSVIAGKNGSAIERAETSSQTGNSPS